MTKNNKAVLVLVLVAVLFSAVIFIIPFEKGVCFWISYVAELVAIALQIPMFKVSFYNNLQARSKILGFPVFRVGYLYLAIQTIVSLALFCVGSFAKDFPSWIALVICIIILGLAVICSLTNEITKESIVEIETNTVQNTEFIKKMRASAAQLVNKANDPGTRKKLEALAENFQYSDPVSSERINNEETALASAFAQLEAAVAANSSDIDDLCIKVQSALDDRNTACKMNKKE